MRAGGFYIAVNDAAVLRVPMELRLELVTIVGMNILDAKRNLADYVVEKVDRAGLGMGPVDFQSPNAGGVVDGRVLVALDSTTARVREYRELDVDLYLMTWYRLLVAFKGTR